jgi:hypothetical protein
MTAHLLGRAGRSIPRARGCHPCLRYVPLPMCPGQTSVGMATPAGLEPARNSLEGYEETRYYQRPVILFRSENWPIAQLKYHRTPSQLWTAARTRGDSWRASDFLAFRRGPQPRLPPPVPLPSSRTGSQTNVLRPVPVAPKAAPPFVGRSEARFPRLVYPAGVACSNAVATVALGHLPIASSRAVISAGTSLATSQVSAFHPLVGKSSVGTICHRFTTPIGAAPDDGRRPRHRPHKKSGTCCEPRRPSYPRRQIRPSRS